MVNNLKWYSKELLYPMEVLFIILVNLLNITKPDFTVANAIIAKNISFTELILGNSVIWDKGYPFLIYRKGCTQVVESDVITKFYTRWIQSKNTQYMYF